MGDAPKRPRGRPRVEVAPDAMERMEQAARVGARWKQVALLGGLEWGTFQDWMAKGKAGEDPERVAFFERLTRARAQGATQMLARMMKLANEGHERALIWILERVHGFNTPDPDEADVSGDTVKVDTPLDRIAAAFDRMMARKAEPGA